MARVLVVDDDRAIRQLLTFVLEMEGHQVAAVEHGQSALALLRETPFAWVVLMDVMMPRMGGVEVCQRLAAEPRDPFAADGGPGRRHAIALMTAGLLEERELPELALRLIRKPFNIDRVARIVGELATELAARELAVVAAAQPEPAPLSLAS